MNWKVQKYQGVPRLGHLQTHTISSQPRYDHFDTAAYSIDFSFLLFWELCAAGAPRYVLPGYPKFFACFSLRRISTSGTPFCSLFPPQAAVANVPTSIPLHILLILVLCRFGSFVQPGRPVMSCPGARNFLPRSRGLQISTSGTPFCSLFPPQAAVANVPTSIPLHIPRHYTKSPAQNQDTSRGGFFVVQ